MNTPHTDAPVESADERLAARLTDYLEGELDDSAAAELDALLDDDAVRSALDDARSGQDLLRGLQRPPVPRDFLRKVQRRVRRRSGGRYFHPAVQPFGWRLSVEVFVVVAVAVMAGCWFIMDVGSRTAAPPIVDEAPTAVEAPAPELPERTPGARLAPPAGEAAPAPPKTPPAPGGGE